MFTLGKTPQNPVGRPLGKIARDLRIELEGYVGEIQSDAAGLPSAELALGYQAVALLLQLESVDCLLRALPRTLDASAKETALRLVPRYPADQNGA